MRLVQPTSGYLTRPLRSLEQAEREIADRREADALYRAMSIANQRIGHIKIGPKPGVAIQSVEPPWFTAKRDAAARGLPMPAPKHKGA